MTCTRSLTDGPSVKNWQWNWVAGPARIRARTPSTVMMPWGANGAYFKGAQRLVPEVEFYYMRNRWYEPKTGRFLSEDPVGLEGGINPYLFAGADPIGGRDPLGLQGQPPPWNCLAGPDGDRMICVPYVFDELIVAGSLGWGTPRYLAWGLQGGHLGGPGDWGEAMRAAALASGSDNPTALTMAGIVPMRRYPLGGGYEFLYDPGRQGGLGPHSYRQGRRLNGIIDARTGEILRHAGRDPEISKSIWRRIGRAAGKAGKGAGWALSVILWLVWPTPTY